MIQAALNDAALTIAHSSNQPQVSQDARAAFLFLLRGIQQRDTTSDR